jgi:hypothetical protein
MMLAPTGFHCLVEQVDLVLDHRLDRRVDRQDHGVAARDAGVGHAVDQQLLAGGPVGRGQGVAPAQGLVEAELDAGGAVALTADPAEHVRCEQAARVHALARRLEADARQAELLQLIGGGVAEGPAQLAVGLVAAARRRSRPGPRRGTGPAGRW